MKALKNNVLVRALLLMSIWCAAWSLHANDDSASIEQAKTALEQAQSALKNAQDTLKQAQPPQAKSTAFSDSALPNTTLFDTTLSDTTGQKPISTNPRNPKASAVANGKLYKWVDDKGNVSYQDSPPPKNVKVLNSDVLKDSKNGDRQVKELRRASTPKPILDGSVPVMVYTADNCKPCQSVVLFLTQKQVPFIERDIRNDRKAREKLSRLSKQISVPSLFIGEQIVQGNSKPQITKALKESGYLK